MESKKCQKNTKLTALTTFLTKNLGHVSILGIVSFLYEVSLNKSFQQYVYINFSFFTNEKTNKIWLF